MNDEVVTRLYRCLVEELRRRGHSPERPVKVSELYQELVPYRAVRSPLGVELNADYEHALLRLLAGERDLLRLEPQTARDELRREVENPYPFVGLFRKFSASNVWIAMDRATEPVPGGAPGPQKTGAGAAQSELDLSAAKGTARSQPAAAPPTGPVTPAPAGSPGGPLRIAAEADSAPAAGRRGGAVPARAPAPVQLHRDGAAADPTERLTHVGADCVFCAEALPAGRRIRFCPHCGGDQRLRPCPRCDAVLEREWRYCIRCGHEVPGP